MDGIDLYHGDCLDIMPQLPAQSIDLILADLPYGTTACAWDSIIPLDKLWAEYKRLIKPRGAIVLTASQPFTSALVMSNPKWLKYELIWDKPLPTGFLDANKRPLKSHESILVFGVKPLYFPQMRKGARHKRGGEKRTAEQAQSDVYGSFEDRAETFSNLYYPTSIIRFAHDPDRSVTLKQRPNKKRHPTQKPLALMEYLILTCSNVGDVVLDNTMGLGTTGEAAIRTSRRFIGIEKDAGYFATARRRIESAQPPLPGAVYNHGLQPTADHAEVENHSHQPGLL